MNLLPPSSEQNPENEKKKETFSRMLVTIYQITRRRMPEESHPD
jgi:hypothetical protein